MPSLEILSSASSRPMREFEGNVLLGRGAGAQILLDDETVSRRHAMVNRVGGAYFVSDLGSGNGTWLNNTRVSKPQRLADGDRLRLGSAVLRFIDDRRIREAAAESEPIRLDAELPADHHVLHSRQAEPSPTSSVPDEEAASDALRLRLQLIYDVVTATGSILDEEALLSLLLEKLFDALPQADRGFILILDADHDELMPRISHDRSGRATPPAVSRTLVTDAIRNRRGVLTLDAMQDERFSGAETVQNMGLRSVLCAPMIHAGEVFGVIQLDSLSAGVSFNPEEMELLLGIAGQAALCLSNARMHRQLVDQRLIRQDLELASRIQRCFLPRRVPEIDRHELALEYRPAMQVGGDYYDFLELGDGRIGIVVGDVSGKGVSAALCMARLSSVARLSVNREARPPQILSRLNRCLLEEFAREGMFATLLLTCLDPASGELKTANAGHPAPFVRRADGTVDPLPVPRNPGLGVDPEARFDTAQARLESGDTLLAYSDGVIEALSLAGEQFGVGRLGRTLRDSEARPGEIVDRVVLAVQNFSRGAPQADDLTVVACGRKP